MRLISRCCIKLTLIHIINPPQLFKIEKKTYLIVFSHDSWMEGINSLAVWVKDDWWEVGTLTKDSLQSHSSMNTMHTKSHLHTTHIQRIYTMRFGIYVCMQKKFLYIPALKYVFICMSPQKKNLCHKEVSNAINGECII